MELIQLSSSLVPRTKQLYRSVKVPIACTVTAGLSQVLPKVQFSNRGILRCVFCKAYINLYCEVSTKEYNWRCNLCSHLNILPGDYSKTLHTPRAELTEACLEIYADEGYMIRPPMCPTFIFLIDISTASYTSGFFHTICDSIYRIVQSEELNERSSIGFILFDTAVHLVQFSDFPNMITLQECCEDMWLPLPTDCFLVNIQDRISEILATIERLRSCAGGDSSAFREGICACKLLLKDFGGKVFAFLCNSYIDAGHPKELSLSPVSDYYSTVAQDLVNLVVSCDLFITSICYSGLVDIGDLAKYTGGNVYFYPELEEQGKEALSQDLWNAVLKCRGWEAGIKLRTSEDWRVSGIVGHFLLREDLIVVPDLSDHYYTFEISPKHEIASSYYLYLQASILYTSSEGARMIRVINHRAQVTDCGKLLLASINLHVLLNFYLKQASQFMVKRRLLLAGQKYLEYRCMEIFKACMEHCKDLPENLSELVVRILGLMKHTLFINTNLPCKCNLDHQNLDNFHYLRLKAEVISPQQSVVWSYPLLYKFENTLTRLRSDAIKNDCVYILDSGMEIVIWIGKLLCMISSAF